MRNGGVKALNQSAGQSKSKLGRHSNGQPISRIRVCRSGKHNSASHRRRSGRNGMEWISAVQATYPICPLVASIRPLTGSPPTAIRATLAPGLSSWPCSPLIDIKLLMANEKIASVVKSEAEKVISGSSGNLIC